MRIHLPGRKGEREGGREGEREGGRERGKEGGRERGREGGRERGREGARWRGREERKKEEGSYAGDPIQSDVHKPSFAGLLIHTGL